MQMIEIEQADEPLAPLQSGQAGEIAMSAASQAGADS